MGIEMRPYREAVAEFQKRYIIQALELCDWRYAEAAEMLELPLRTFLDIRKKLGISRRKRSRV